MAKRVDVNEKYPPAKTMTFTDRRDMSPEDLWDLYKATAHRARSLPKGTADQKDAEVRRSTLEAEIRRRLSVLSLIGKLCRGDWQ